MVSLSEQKEGQCQICSEVFVKRRYDQRFCSKISCKEGAKSLYQRTHWFDRPDREAQNERRRESYYANRPAVLAKLRQWRVEHSEEARARDQARYEKNKEKHAERTKAYREAHPELRRKEYKNSRSKTPWMLSFRGARHRSLKKGWSFDLTYEWCVANWTGKCAVTDVPFQFGVGKLHPYSPSLDRNDNSKGYTQDNCRFVLHAVNNFKGTGTDEDMLVIAQAIVNSRQNAAPDMP